MFEKPAPKDEGEVKELKTELEQMKRDREFEQKYGSHLTPVQRRFYEELEAKEAMVKAKEERNRAIEEKDRQEAPARRKKHITDLLESRRLRVSVAGRRILTFDELDQLGVVEQLVRLPETGELRQTDLMTANSNLRAIPVSVSGSLRALILPSELV